MALVYGFDHEHPRPPMELKGLLGGKGANLAEMTSVLRLPVPPGFTISTKACQAYMLGGWPGDLTEEVDRNRHDLEERMGMTLGDPEAPLLVSVRSGARFSMPGMMDTVLNLGLNDESVEGLAAQTDDPRFAYDSYRRFIQMYGKIVAGVEGEAFDMIFDDAKTSAGVVMDHELTAESLGTVIERYKELVDRRTGEPFPQDPREQLRGAIEAVFSSWNSPRAIAYRRREHITGNEGTAVNVQAMVFGNRDDDSGTGVGFTRNPATGEQGSYGDFLVNAQGEDVVAGIRRTLPLETMREIFPGPYAELLEIFDRLEAHYRDMLDTEFTIEQGKLWMLQTRVGKRTGAAALRIAVAMTRDPQIELSHAEAVQRVSPEHLDQLLHPQFQTHDKPVIATGLAASPGAAVGQVYFTANDAVEAVNRGERVILVRDETSPEDVHGMEVAEGVLTSRGGLVSHAAVVARGWGKPAVVGAESLEITAGSFSVDGTTVTEGETISINGTTGQVVRGELALSVGSVPEEFELVLAWADAIRGRKLGVRANADNAEDAARARIYGAEGIGLARTEHMFMGDRLPMVRRVILADGAQEEAAALAELLEAQRSDFEELLEAMDGLPVTIRLLDPPLHEFLPSMEEVIQGETAGDIGDKAKKLFKAARTWREQNPMLGTRGVRLGIIKGGLYEMQVRAAAEAAKNRKEAGGTPILELMVPLVATQAEMALVRGWIEEELDDVLGPARSGLYISVGSMIETPRAAVRGDDIAEVADFFSFGTNDLTQMTFGFSRDDVEGRMMPRYLMDGLLPRNPFETIDHRGVGELVRTGVERGRSVKPDLEVGVCGEHGGDPESVAFFYSAGLDYVSCSPFRVPIARLAAAQAVLAERGSEAISTA
jgi:pyruvate,orthophosphate dikinase